MCQIYCSKLEDKIKFTYKIYDFNHEGSISPEDVRLVLSYIPIETLDVSHFNQQHNKHSDGMLQEKGDAQF
jgi:Ca2+-binding EF-hand superfamily protein